MKAYGLDLLGCAEQSGLFSPVLHQEISAGTSCGAAAEIEHRLSRSFSWHGCINSASAKMLYIVIIYI